MASRIYALLVGINDYSPHVGKLHGCLNDVANFRCFLEESYGSNSLALETLTDSDATRPNIVEQFRFHLGRATREDTVIFFYGGHGARSKSASPFKDYFPDEKDEGLVCYGSRDPGGFDLADKELAVLLGEVAKNDPHIAVILDCCHSGSATRDADSFTHFKPRQTHEVFEERPLESYLEGYYAELLAAGKSFSIPASRHILLSACQRDQKAWEGNDRSGVFSTAFLEVLNQSGPAISYADLFVRCRAAVRKRAENQEPQFETYRNFNAYDGFLGRAVSKTVRRYRTYFDTGSWKVDCGAIQGIPIEPDKVVQLALFPESKRDKLAGHAEIVQVGAQKSELKLLDFEPDPESRYQAEITSLPLPPLMVHLTGESEGIEAIEQFLAASEEHRHSIFFTHEEEGTSYVIEANDGGYFLKLRESGKLIQGARGFHEEAASYIFFVLKRIAVWQNALRLQNPGTRMNPSDIPFSFFEIKDDGSSHEFQTTEATFDIGKDGKNWRVVRGTLKGSNRSGQPLYFLLVHFSEDYGIRSLYNERVEPTESEFTITLDGNGRFNLSLEESEGDQSMHTSNCSFQPKR